MTAVSDRIAFKELCITTLETYFAANDLADVAVHYDDFGETPSNEMVMLGTLEGNAEANVFGPAGSTDEFTIDTAILTYGHETVEDADRRCQELLNAVNLALFNGRFARTLGAVAFPGKQDGPNAGTDPETGLSGSFAEIQIACRISLRGS